MRRPELATAATEGESGPASWEPSGRAWFCVRSQPKREHVAALHLLQLPELEVFLPRIRFRRPTARGPMWVTEALFPGYLFACFDWSLQLRQVHHTSGVAGVVHFGNRWPTVSAEVIQGLRHAVGDMVPRVIPGPFRPGDTAEIVCGVFRGWEGILTRVLPARQRVQLLLDFLGRQVSVEVPIDQVKPCEAWRVRWDDLLRADVGP